MTRIPNIKRLLPVVAVVAVVAGGGAALAASNGSKTSENGFLARVAGHLGISTQKLQDATKAAAIDQVDADLEAGRITKAQADQMKARINVGDFPGFGGPGRFHHEGFGEHGARGGHLSAAATYLGLTVPQLLDKLSNGKTLAAVAKVQNKSVEGLKQAMLDASQKQLDQAVKDGMLTAAQAKAEQAEHKSRIDGLINGTFRGPGRHEEFRFRGGGPGASAPAPTARPAF